ncbi:LysR family transcriptional regulator [Litorivicinus sp.]|nr:LysR family transcriptional regulator [Litorivicinus sp.]
MYQLNRIPKSFFGHLTSFITVAEFMNFRTAAQTLGRSQPAISAQISQLEDYLGTILIERTTRVMRLTTAGEFLLDRGKRILGDTRQLVSDVQTARFITPNQIMISLAPTIAANLIPECLAIFKDSNPKERVLISEHLGPEMFDALKQRDVQFGIGPYRNTPKGISFTTLFQQELFLIVHKSHSFAERGFALLSDLPDLPLLCAAPGTTAREVLDHALMTRGLIVKPRYEALQYQTLFVLASTHHGATVMPVVNFDLLAAMDLAPVPFKDFPMQRSIGLLMKEDEKIDTASASLLSTLLTVAKRHYALTANADQLIEETDL